MYESIFTSKTDYVLWPRFDDNCILGASSRIGMRRLFEKLRFQGNQGFELKTDTG